MYIYLKSVDNRRNKENDEAVDSELEPEDTPGEDISQDAPEEPVQE